MSYTNNLFYVQPEDNRLVSPYQRHEEGELIEEANSMSVTLLSAYVAEELEGMCRGDNDILIISRSRAGTKPLVERVHTYQRGVEPGNLIDIRFGDSVFTTDDYTGSDPLRIELLAIEVDSDTQEREQVIQTFDSLAGTAGAAFPVIAPYAFGAKTLVNVVDRIVEMIEEDDYIINHDFELKPGEPDRGETPLQTGAYVLFSEGPEDPDRYRLNQRGLLERKGDDRKPEVSYIVLTIDNEPHPQRRHVTSQKIATLLTQIRSGNQSTAKKTIQFLDETLTAYDNFKKLQRYRELQETEDKTDAMKEQMDNIEHISELQPFLPDGNDSS